MRRTARQRRTAKRDAMTKQKKPVEKFDSLLDVMSHILDNEEIDDEERLLQIELITVLSKLPIEKLLEVQAKFNAKLKYCQPLRVIKGGKR